MQTSDRAKSILPSATIAAAAKARELKAQGIDIISLSLGEPDFDTPRHICDAAIDAINEGHLTHYPPVDGIPELKNAIIKKLADDNQLNYKLDEVLVSAGAKHSLYNAFQALLNPGDEIIIPAPFWVSYPDMAKLAGAMPVVIPTNLEARFKITPKQLENAITPKTRLFIINSPSNPSGMTYTKEELAALGAVLEKHPDIMILSDDIYEHIYWADTPFCNILMACPALRDRTIIVNGVSKAYAMTGWRIGYLAAHADFVKEAKKIQSQSTSGVCGIAQAAAATALTASQDCVKSMVKTFKERHDYIVPALNEIQGFCATETEGAFYCFIDASELIRAKGMADDVALAEHLINKAHVALVPGGAFGLKNHLRLSYATDLETLKEAIKRLKACLG